MRRSPSRTCATGQRGAQSRSTKDRPFVLYDPIILVLDEHTPTPDTEPASACHDFDTELKLATTPRQGDDMTRFPDMLTYMDRLIGRTVDKLNEHGLRQNAPIVRMGDNATKIAVEARQVAALPTRRGDRGGAEVARRPFRDASRAHRFVAGPVVNTASTSPRPATSTATR